MSESVMDAAPQPSEFIQTVAKNPAKRLEWIREHLGDEAYREALALRTYRAHLAEKAKAGAR